MRWSFVANERGYIIIGLIGLDWMGELKLQKPITDIIEEQRNVTQVTKSSKGTFKEYYEKNRQIEPSNTATGGAAKNKVDFIWKPIKKSTSQRVSSACPESLLGRK